MRRTWVLVYKLRARGFEGAAKKIAEWEAKKRLWKSGEIGGQLVARVGKR
jgi:hypothetical protein